MKKKIACIAAAFVLFFALAGCASREENKKHALENYSVVYAENDGAAKTAAEKIAAAMKDDTGKTLPVKGDSASASGAEILVGNVRGRSYSYYAPRFSKKGGWDVRALDGCVYITSNTGEYDGAVAAFTEKFIRSEFGNGTSTSSASALYRINSAQALGMPLGCYDVVYPDGDKVSEKAAKEICAWLEENSGYVLFAKVQSETENFYTIALSPEKIWENAEICTVEADATSLTVRFAAAETERAADSFIAHFFRSENRNVILGETAESYRIWEYLDSDYEESGVVVPVTALAEGVTWRNFTMTDENGTPQSVYVLEALAGGNWNLRVGTHPGYAKGSPVLSDVFSTAKAYQSAGEDVLFACNGGYFRMGNGDEPEGILISDGKMLSRGLGVKHHDFFGVYQNGKFAIGEYDLLSKISGELAQACGGRGVIVKEGKPFDISYTEGGDAIGTNAHPRTSVGFRKNGDLIAIVVDGRQNGYSAGVNLVDLAQIFIGLNVEYALNLDGGGSSTFVTKGEDGTLAVRNKTCNFGNALRKVGDCLILTAAGR